MSGKFNQLISITIPVPYDEPRRQGIYANTTAESGMIYFRTNQFDKVLLDTVCKELELRQGTFARFCTMRVAQALEDHQNAYLKSLKSG